MSLRDYFAAKAIPEAINTRPAGLRWFVGLDYNGAKPVPEKVAAQCYAVADAMLAERAKAKS